MHANDGTPPTRDDRSLLEVNGLTTRFFTDMGQINAVERVDLQVGEGEVLGIVGESGSGKSVLANSIIDTVDDPGRIVDGEVWYRDEDFVDDIRPEYDHAIEEDCVDVRQLSPSLRRWLRGTAFSMVFQDPMSSFDPTATVGEQIAEAVEANRRATDNPEATRSSDQGYGFTSFLASFVLPSKRFVTSASRQRAVELLEDVGISDARQRADEYPHQFSGGMLQRAMVAQALASEPELLIADEPTTALDVTTQAQILALLKRLQEERQMSIILVSHNLGVIARMCDRVNVMYAGEIVERGSLRAVFNDPTHPYTQGLIDSLPSLSEVQERLTPMEGNVPSLRDEVMEERCYFADRCPHAMDVCLSKPDEYPVNGDSTHLAKCYLADDSMTTDEELPEGYFNSGVSDD